MPFRDRSEVDLIRFVTQPTQEKVSIFHHWTSKLKWERRKFLLLWMKCFRATTKRLVTLKFQRS